MKTEKNPAAVALGSMRSKKKAASSRENGKKGGRWSRDKIIKICRETSSKKMNCLLDAQQDYRKLKSTGLVEDPADKQGAFGPVYEEDEIKLAKLIDKCGDEGTWGDVTDEAMYNNNNYNAENYIEEIAKLKLKAEK